MLDVYLTGRSFAEDKNKQELYIIFDDTTEAEKKEVFELLLMFRQKKVGRSHLLNKNKPSSSKDLNVKSMVIKRQNSVKYLSLVKSNTSPLPRAGSVKKSKMSLFSGDKRFSARRIVEEIEDDS